MTLSRAKTFGNILYSIFAKGAALVCLAVSSSVVARNLTAADYGVVGFATIIIGFLSHFSDMGVGSAVIRHPQLEQRGLQTAFTLKLLLSSGAFIAALLVAPFARHLFEHPETGNVIRVLSLNFLVSTIGFLPLVTLTREMNYRALVIPGIVSMFVRCALTVALIRCGWKFWAVIWADVGATLVSGIIIQVMKRIPIRFTFNWTAARDYLRFGMPLLGVGVLVFTIFNLDNFLIGAFMGSAPLGYYALAFNWGSFICVLLADTVNSVLFPAFSIIQDDQIAMRRWYLKTVDLVALVAVVGNTALLANTHFFLVTFLGKGSDKWLPAALPLEILCVYGIIRAITEPLGNCLVARSQTRTLLRANILAGVVEILLLVAALRSGKIAMVAVAVLVAYTCQLIVYLPFLRSEFSIGIPEIFAQIWPVAPALIVGCLVTSFLPSSLGRTMTTLAARGLITALVVGLTHGFCTSFRCFHEASGMIAQNLRRAKA
jgi:O-antigen/teichoic acid export membrane protein